MDEKPETSEFYGPLIPGSLVSAKVGAVFLGVGKTKFWALVAEGKLTPVRFGTRCTRFRSDDVISLINGAA